MRRSLWALAKKAPKQIMSVSETAAERIKTLMKSKGEEVVGVKIGLRRRGCNGLTYTMNYTNKEDIKKGDEVVEDKGVTVVVDAKAVMFLVGTQMNFVETDIGSEFVFDNPNKKSECGCGQSFNV
ncbi:unnamed protein product [Vitrella brassicaformis CCMP3155]|uniref:Core domain-containing protein n=1 Tax=Vitrella brassicaformis (strain CCMP3155) TaxID=1169540 RepID=A0A0G4GM72_VITBC|nr:unnamed protein product [Vitrella brassicaformis CCMP3155]|mmetsp:Transcript_2791/g.6381  ORF Transcript_2791/g.6381 Transcript_2791/m.6381 type:complete len:125 (-) Transcript_2791:637-1011(-)|eukprot:CEM31297.1 unnamed protein product [Vitrella brassicaformis CCMP3155]